MGKLALYTNIHWLYLWLEELQLYQRLIDNLLEEIQYNFRTLRKVMS